MRSCSLRGSAHTSTSYSQSACLLPFTSPKRSATRRQYRTRCDAQHSPDRDRRSILFSFAGLAVVPLDIVDVLQDEISLWQQELRFYQRQFQIINSQINPEATSNQLVAVAIDKVQLDTDLAGQLLSIPLRALQEEGVYPGWDRKRYTTDFKRIFNQELPYFKETKACGHCNPGESLADRAWFDFLSYIQYKAITLQLPPARLPGSDQALVLFEMMHGPTPQGRQQQPQGPSGQELLRQASGRLLLSYIKANCDAEDKPALASSSPLLDDVRRGVRAILTFFEDTGFASDSGIAFFGASKAEDRNHEVWARGEPAYLKFWVEAPATFRSSGALQAEDGFSQDFIFSAIEAYLAQCGVVAGYYRRYPSSTIAPVVMAEQCTIQLLQPLRPAAAEAGGEAEVAAKYAPFELDPCPANTGMGCF